MPNWPTGMQSFVNGWVKVNTKHVVFPQGRGEGQQHGEVWVQQSAAHKSSESSARALQAPPVNLSRLHDRHHSKGEHVSHTTATTASSTIDPEKAAIRKYNSTSRRRLQRSVSHSDLLREMAKEEDKPNKNGKQRSDPGKEDSSQSRNSSRVQPDNDSHKKQHSLGQASRQQPQRPLLTTGKYLNEAAFVRQLELQKAQYHRGSASTSTGGSNSESSPSRPLHEERLEAQLAARFHNTRQEERASGSPQRKESPHAAASCTACQQADAELLTAYQDMAYLRDAALRSELGTFPAAESSRPSLSTHELTTLANASKRLMEVTARHRRQIEQMTRETTRKQHDMHFKHSKISMICKELNEESSIRKQEALGLQVQVRKLQAERDSLATQVQRLQAQVVLHDLEEKEHAVLRDKVTQYENGSLDTTDQAIRQRDRIIADLSMRLERTMETLQIEREQQRQRRQIIFPTAKNNKTKSKNSQQATAIEMPKDFAALQEELRIAKEAAQAAETLAETTKRTAAEKEAMLMARCNELEGRLQALEERGT